MHILRRMEHCPEETTSCEELVTNRLRLSSARVKRFQICQYGLCIGTRQVKRRHGST